MPTAARNCAAAARAAGEPERFGGGSQITPQIGVTSTPVIDQAQWGTVSPLEGVQKTYYQRLHALDVTTGAELLNGPVAITATYPVMGGTMSFDPQQYAERAALLLMQGTVYISFTSHCDDPPYSGWVMAYNEGTLAQTAVFNAAPNSGGAGPAIWILAAVRQRTFRQRASAHSPTPVASRLPRCEWLP